MKDQRLKVFSAAVDALTESLDALVRVSRWTGVEAPPEELSAAVSKLVDRLGVASRLVSNPFQGIPADMRKVSAMCGTMKRLDAAYVAYRKRIASTPEQVVDAATALEFEMSEAARALSPA
jgi:hypothetical protein